MAASPYSPSLAALAKSYQITRNRAPRSVADLPKLTPQAEALITAETPPDCAYSALRGAVRPAAAADARRELFERRGMAGAQHTPAPYRK